MSNKIIIKHGETVPTNTILDNFELGYCINDGLLYINNGSTIKKIGSDIATTINALSINEKAAGDKAVYDFVTGGFTLEGNLILNANPTLNLQAATKEYVDNATSSIQDTIDTVGAIATNHASRHGTGGADALSPADIGALPSSIVPSDIGAAPALQVLTGTLLSTAWTGTEAPYTQTVTVIGMTASASGVIGLPDTVTAQQREAARSAMLFLTAKDTDSVTISADGEAPETDIPFEIQIGG